MTYLWLQILGSLLIAALIGAWFSYWWIKRRYEDVTSFYEASAIQPQTSASGLTREDLNASLTSLKSSVSTIQMPDIKPLHARLGVIENRLNEPVNEIRGLSQRMNDIDGALAMLKLSISELRNTDLNPIETRLNSLSQLVQAQDTTDLTPVSNRLQHIEEAIGALQVPETDLGPIHSGLAQLEMAIAAIDLPQTDIMPIRNDIAGLEARIGTLQQRVSEGRSVESEAFSSELSGMHTSLASLTTSMAAIGTTDLNPLHNRINQLEDNLSQMTPPPVDLSIITQRLDILRSEINTPDQGMEGLHEQIAQLEQSLGRLKPEPVDFGIITQRLDILRSEVSTPDQALDGLHARLASIENGVSGIDLGSLYHRMDTLDANLSTIRNAVQSGPNFAPLEQRLVGLQEAVRNMPGPDFSPVINSVHAIESRLDLGALENRMTSIEYGLAALHHTLRTRSENSSDTRSTSSLRDNDVASASTEFPSPPPAPVWETPSSSERDYTRTERTYSRSERAPRTEREPRAERQPRTEREPRIEREPRADRQPRNYRNARSDRYSNERDTLQAARRPGDKANLLISPAFGASDELERISGVGPMLHDLLTGIGVYYFWQIAEWGPNEIEWVDDMLDGFNGRIERDNWVGQAQIFAAEQMTANRP